MSQTINLFGMTIDNVTLREATRRVLDWCQDEPSKAGCRYVVTPNVDHAVMYRTRGDLRTAYADASMVLADGAPLIAASKLLRQPLPERVAGSDLTPAVLAAAEDADRPLRVFLLGAGPGIADQAAARILKRYKNVTIVGTHCPPLGFEHDQQASDEALAAVSDASPDLLIVGLGAPKQELWVSKHRRQLDAKVALCVGATIDFLAGHKRRSPVWMRKVGLEWAHRVATEPRRLAARYAKDAWVFPQLVWRQWREAQPHLTANRVAPAGGSR